jgi:hypothetical protein
LDEFIQAAWPVLVLLGALLAYWAIRRYLFAKNCWRCGFQLGGISERRKKKRLGFMSLVQCRRCGANSIRIR